MKLSHIHVQRLDDDACPGRFKRLAHLQRIKRVYWTGSVAVLDLPCIAVFAPRSISSACLLKAYGMLDAMAEAPVTFAGGWHSATERDILERLLGKGARVIFAAARGIEHCNPPRDLGEHVSGERVLIFSRWGPRVSRPIRENALKRNAAVVALSDAVFVPHAVPGTQTFKTACTAVRGGKPVATVADAANEALVAAGTAARDSGSIGAWLATVTSKGDSADG